MNANELVVSIGGFLVGVLIGFAILKGIDFIEGLRRGKAKGGAVSKILCKYIGHHFEFEEIYEANGQRSLFLNCAWCKKAVFLGSYVPYSYYSIVIDAENDAGLREKLADYAHQAWSGWMKYLFKEAKVDKNHNVVISTSYALNLVRQMTASYGFLSEDEKESDRAEARKMIKIFSEWLKKEYRS